MNGRNGPAEIHALTTPHGVDELVHLDMQLRSKLLHALRCQDCQDALLTHLLKSSPAPKPGTTPDEESTRRALAVRAAALDHWLGPPATDSAKVDIPLLHALALFEESGNLVEATATRAILGLFYTDTAPELAEKCLHTALLHSDRLPDWLWAFSFASFELCLARLGEVPPDLTLPSPAMEGDDWLRFLWIRTRAALSSTATDQSEVSDHEQSLTEVLAYFVRSALLEESVLVATDLARSYALRGRPEEIQPLRLTLFDLAHELEPVDPEIRSALESFSSLGNLGDGRSFATAAAPIFHCIPSIHRYGERMLVDASELLVPSADPSLLEAIRAFLLVRANEQIESGPAAPCRNEP